MIQESKIQISIKQELSIQPNGEWLSIDIWQIHFLQAVDNLKEHVVTEQISMMVEVPPPPTVGDILGHTNRSELQ